MHKKLMIVGPTEIEDEILNVASKPQVYMRTPEFSERLKGIYQNLQYVFQTNNPVFFFASSGTGALDAAVTNFLSKNEKILVINGGAFGQRWVDIARTYKVNPIEIKVEFGDNVCIEDIEQAIKSNTEATALYATLGETSSGALTDIKAIGNLLKKYPNILFVVDCVSALIANEFLMDSWGVDVAISASQKAFAIPPGLAFMAVNQKAIDKASKAGLQSYYYNLQNHLQNYYRNQTPFTPAISLLFQLEKRLEKIKLEGLKQHQIRYKKLTQRVRDGVEKLGFHVFPISPANCVTAIMTNQYDASEIVRILSQKHNIEIAPSGGELKTKMIRIGNFGDINNSDIDDLLKALETTTKELVNDKE